MTKFRRHIAIFILALFTCQSVMAGIGEHLAFSSDSEAKDAQHLSLVGHFFFFLAQHGQPDSQDVVDTNCCHAHGHCHILVFVDAVNPASMPHGRSFTSLYSYSYHFLLHDPLLRPPTSA